MRQQESVDEIKPADTTRERVVLGAVTNAMKQLFWGIRRHAQHLDATLRRRNQTGHQVHQRGLTGAVWADKAGDPRPKIQRHAVHAQHFAVELADALKNDAVAHPRTTSFACSRWLSRSSEKTIATSSTSAATPTGNS